MKTRSIYFLSFIIALASCMKEEPVLFDNQTKCTPMSSTEELALEAVKADKERLAGHEKDSLILTDSKASFGTDANLPTESDDNPDWYIPDVYVLSGARHTFHIPSGIVGYELTPLGERAKILEKVSAPALARMFEQTDDYTLVYTNIISPKEIEVNSNNPVSAKGINNTMSEDESQRILKYSNLDYSFNLKVSYRNGKGEVSAKDIVIWPIVGPVTINMGQYLDGSSLCIGSISQNTPFLEHSSIFMCYESCDYDGVRIQHYAMPQIWENRSISVGAGTVIGLGQMFRYVKEVKSNGVSNSYDNYIKYNPLTQKFEVAKDGNAYYDPYLINIVYSPLGFANSYFVESNISSLELESKDFLKSPTNYRNVKYCFDAKFSSDEISAFKSDINQERLPQQWLDRHVQVKEKFPRGSYQPTLF